MMARKLLWIMVILFLVSVQSLSSYVFWKDLLSALSDGALVLSAIALTVAGNMAFGEKYRFLSSSAMAAADTTVNDAGIVANLQSAGYSSVAVSGAASCFVKRAGDVHETTEHYYRMLHLNNIIFFSSVLRLICTYPDVWFFVMAVFLFIVRLNGEGIVLLSIKTERKIKSNYRKQRIY